MYSRFHVSLKLGFHRSLIMRLGKNNACFENQYLTHQLGCSSSHPYVHNTSPANSNVNFTREMQNELVLNPGSQISAFFSWRARSIPRCQSKSHIKMIYKINVKLVHESYGTCFPVQCETLRVNRLTPLLVVTMPYSCWLSWARTHIILMTSSATSSSFSIRGRVFWWVVLREV